jgi:S1-C subfamily serine protease
VRRARAAALPALAAALLAAGCGGGKGQDARTVRSETTRVEVLQESAEAQRGGGFDPSGIYRRESPGVVTILATGFGSGGGADGGLGSGFVVSDSGEIATNAHVVTDASAGGGSSLEEAKEVYVQFPDRNQVAADIVGFDPQSDVALLKVDPDGLNLQPLELGTSDGVTVGQPVAAIGSPFGEDRSLSVGVVSATDRSIESLTRFRIEGAIQTDASINPGNSGGPLLDADGKVIGINQQINTTSGGNEGVGFAVPISLAARALDQLRDHGSVNYAYIGVTTQALYPQLADRLGLPTDTGALVSKVVPGGPADDAGLQGSDQEIRFQGERIDVGGDVIVAVNGHRIVTENDLPELISRLSPGDTATLQIIRDGNTRNVDVKLGERPDSVQ